MMTSKQPWNHSMTRVVSERKGFQLVARCNVLQGPGHGATLSDDEIDENDTDKLIAQRQEFLTGTITSLLLSLLVLSSYSILLGFRSLLSLLVLGTSPDLYCQVSLLGAIYMLFIRHVIGLHVLSEWRGLRTCHASVLMF